MLILAGLLGMMAFGSVMLYETNTKDAESREDAFDDIDSLQIDDSTGDLLSFIDKDGDIQTLANETTEAADLLIGTDGDDEIFGSLGNDKIMAGAGDDTVNGDSDDDILMGNEGNDALFGGEGSDALSGDQGRDALSGGDGDDTLTGNADSDHLSGGNGADNLMGGEGDDSLWGDAGDDTLVASAGNDFLIGGNGNDLLLAGTGNDVLDGRDDGEATVDYLNGGEGDDTFFADAGDQVSGGDGADMTVLHSDISGPIQIWDFESGEDTLVVLYGSEDDVPEVSISQTPDENGQWVVQSDGKTIALVSGTEPIMSDINLVHQT